MKRQIIERDRSLQNLIGRRLFTEVYFREMAARYDVSLPERLSADQNMCRLSKEKKGLFLNH